MELFDKKIEIEKKEEKESAFIFFKKALIVLQVVIGLLALCWSFYLIYISDDYSTGEVFCVLIGIVGLTNFAFLIPWTIYAYLKGNFMDRIDNFVTQELMNKLNEIIFSKTAGKKIIKSQFASIFSAEQKTYQLLTGNSGYQFYYELRCVMYALEDKIYFFAAPTNDADVLKSLNFENLNEFSLPASQIVSYRLSGDRHYVPTISGGGGGMFGGAMAGGSVFGGIQPITTEIKRIDERTTTITYMVDEDSYEFLTLDADAYDFLKIICPEKDEKVISMKLATSGDTNSTVSTTKKSDSTISEIEKYYELMQKGILTEEEFNDKKKSLLNK